MDKTQVNIPLPACVSLALSALESEGFEAWVVGGCVRDALLGRETNDYDIATAAPWTDTERVLADEGFVVHRTGIKHGTVTAVRDNEPIEITTYRTDGEYRDGRHPDNVEFVQSIEEDLARRDFTINALAYHPQRGLLDRFDGIGDLKAHTIRTVGDPVQRFREDGLRILRASRFSSQLGFSIDPRTLQAMNSCKMMLTHVSAERVTHELDGLLLGAHAHDALMECVDVLGAVMPEIMACKGFDQHSPYHIYDVWEHTAWVVQQSPATRLLRWSALLHDIGKPGACFFEGERAHFFGHAKLSALMAEEILARLSVSPAFASHVVTLVRLHDNQFPATEKGVKRALASLDGDIELFESLIALKRADAMAHSEQGQERVQLADDLALMLRNVVEAGEAFTVKQLAINGNDVKALGILAGPAIGQALQEALDAVIDERVPNEREALLRYLKGRD